MFSILITIIFTFASASNTTCGLNEITCSQNSSISCCAQNQRCERTSGLCKSLHELSTVIYVGIGGMSFVFVVLMCAVHWKQKRQGTRPSVTTRNAERTAHRSQQRPGQGTIRGFHVPALYNINTGTSDHNIYGESPPLYQCATANLPHDSSRMTSPSV